MTYLRSIGGGGSVDGTGNNFPAVNGGADYVIPRDTPFKLTAVASDADAGDAQNLTYVWEQMDAGASAFINPAYSDADDPQNTTRPIFRPFSPSTDPSRIFPSLHCILNTANVPPAIDSDGFQTAEFLPNVTRAINFATLTQTAHRTCFGVTIPSTAKAVVGNATVVNFISSGLHWITLYPFGVPQPTASNINFGANHIIPHAFVVGLSSDGKFNIYSHASTHFIVDLNGYFAP
jgi:hypothetical protein